VAGKKTAAPRADRVLYRKGDSEAGLEAPAESAPVSTKRSEDLLARGGPGGRGFVTQSGIRFNARASSDEQETFLNGLVHVGSGSGTAAGAAGDPRPRSDWRHRLTGKLGSAARGA